MRGYHGYDNGMTVAEGILMLLVVPEPGQEAPPCPWGRAINAALDPCDGSGKRETSCPLCIMALARDPQWGTRR